jgi:hypothetical protein
MHIDYTHLLEIVFILVWSATKFMVGIATAIVLGLPFWLAMTLTIGGGMAGVVFFTYFWKGAVYWWHRLAGGTAPASPAVTGARKSGKPSLKARVLEQTRTYFGLPGIALLTPVFLTVPIGTFAALSISKNRWEIMLYMLGAFVLWAGVFLGLNLFFGEQGLDWFRRMAH